MLFNQFFSLKIIRLCSYVDSDNLISRIKVIKCSKKQKKTLSEIKAIIKKCCTFRKIKFNRSISSSDYRSLKFEILRPKNQFLRSMLFLRFQKLLRYFSAEILCWIRVCSKIFKVNKYKWPLGIWY